MKTSKIITVLALILGSPAIVSAATISSNTTPTAQPISATGMVTQGFNITLSKDVSLGYAINAADATVVGGHKQSVNQFGGSTNGGSVAQCGTKKTKGNDVTATTCS